VLSVVLRKHRQTRAFTLIELLTVIGIIAILAALILEAGNGVMEKARRSRAAGEVQAMSTALDGYKIDNGIYPSATMLLGPPAPGTYPADPIVSNAGLYQNSSEALYQALSGGQTAYTAAPIAGAKFYMSFKPSQIGNPAALSYIKDPWGYSYGYSTGDGNVAPAAQNQYPNNGSGFFDLWSTAGTKGTKATDINAWVSNWQ